jgi:hypothetical protein
MTAWYGAEKEFCSRVYWQSYTWLSGASPVNIYIYMNFPLDMPIG